MGEPTGRALGLRSCVTASDIGQVKRRQAVVTGGVEQGSFR
jgi:hypothetical protein